MNKRRILVLGTILAACVGIFVAQADSTSNYLSAISLVTQGASITSKKQLLGGTSTTTAAPTYVDSTVNPLSTDTGGSLRVTLTAGTTSIGKVTGGVTTNAAAPVATSLLGVLPAVVNTANPSLTNTYLAALSQTGAGSLRTSSVGRTAVGTAVAEAPVTVGAVAATYGSSPTAAVAGAVADLSTDLSGKLYVNTGHPRAVNCNLASAGTTAVQITGCEVVASNSYYITSISISGDAATIAAKPAQVISGTSTDCTGPHVLYQCQHGATAACIISFPTPIKATVAEGLCVLDANTGTKNLTVTGYIAP